MHRFLGMKINISKSGLMWKVSTGILPYWGSADRYASLADHRTPQHKRYIIQLETFRIHHTDLGTKLDGSCLLSGDIDPTSRASGSHHAWVILLPFSRFRKGSPLICGTFILG